MKSLFLFVLLIVFGACQSKNEATTVNASQELKQDTKFEIYNMSEMSTLMEQMYAYNLQLKHSIETKAALGEYPSFFKELHTATLTEPSDRDPFFNTQVDAFLLAQQNIYVAKDTVAAFNTMVNACISCHEKKCGGPIVRIKKLYIK